MSEGVYRDLGGGCNLPADTFKDSTSEGIMRVLRFMQPSAVDSTGMGWRELAHNVKQPDLSDDTRIRLERLSPGFLEIMGFTTE